MKQLLLLIISLLGFQFAIAQNAPLKIGMTPENWVAPENAIFEQFDGRGTLVLKRGNATVKNQVFENGIIEVDVYGKEGRSFGGIRFRAQDGNMEEVYMRLHKSNQADAVQYTPVFNNELNWQLYRELQAKVSFKPNAWNALRVEVEHKSATVFINGEKVLTIDELRTAESKGAIGLWALFGSRFSNFRLTHKTVGEDTNPVEIPKAEANIISNWEITKAFSYEGILPSFDAFSKEKYTKVSTEASGLLPISKFIQKPSAGQFEQNKENYVVATTTIQAEKEEIRLFSFDYSDKIIVYLNGEILFVGNNAFRHKGVQYMGHMNINTNTLYLPLRKGKNTIHCVIIDKANGWGLMGMLE